MAHREQIIAAVLALWGTEQLAGGDAVPWLELEERLDIDLTGRSDAASRVRFLEDEHGSSVPPADWLEDIVRQGGVRLGLLPTRVVADDTQEVRLDGVKLEEHVRHAFAGSGGVLLFASLGDRHLLYRTRVGLPPETTLDVKAVLTWIESQPEPEALRESLLWEDEYNLHVTDGTDWSLFVSALGPEHDEELVGTMDRCVNNTRFEQGEAEAWQVLKEEHATPDRAWQFRFIALGDAHGAIPKADVGEQSKRLATALTEIESYAKEIGQPRWAEWFQGALALLASEPLPPWMDPMFGSAPLDEPARRLIAASIQADVFGGMGSWNDLNPDDHERYSRLSDALFSEMTPGLVTAVNATTQRAAQDG